MQSEQELSCTEDAISSTPGVGQQSLNADVAALLAEEHEARLVAALHASSTGTFRWNIRTGDVFFDAAMKTLWGFPEDTRAIPLSEVSERIHPDDRQQFLELVQVCAEQGADFEQQYRIRLPDGSERWLLDKGSVIQDAAQGEPYMIGACVDITPLKASQALLEQTVREARRHSQEVQCLYALSRLIELEEDLASFLRQAVQIIPLAFEQVGGAIAAVRQGDEIFLSAPLDDRTCLLREVLMAQGQPFAQLEVYCQPEVESDGGYRLFVHQMAGKMARAIERKLALQALRENEDRWRAMTSALAEGVVLHDAQGQVVTWNPSAERLLDLSLLELQRERGDPAGWAAMRDDGSDFPYAEQPALVSLRTGEPCDDVIMGVHNSQGELRWLSVNSRPLFRDGETRPYAVVTSFDDITDRRQAEVVLQQEMRAKELERLRLRAVLDVLPLGVYIADASGRLEEVNSAATQIWGDAPLSESPNNYAHDYKAWWPQNGQPVQAHEWGMARALTNGEVVAAEEMEVQRSDGSRGTILNYALPIRDASGEIAGGVAVNVDITELKRSQQRIALLGAIAENSPDAIASADRQGRITSWNQGAEQMYGYRSEEILGRPISILMPPEHQHEMADLLNRINRGQRVPYYDTVRLTKDGRRINVSIAVSPILDGRGQVTGAAAVARDITERKRNEDKLALLATIVETTSDAILSLDLDGRIQTWNRGAETLFGYTREEAIGHSISIIVPEDYRDETLSVLSIAFSGESIPHFDTVRRCKNGELVNISVAISPICNKAGVVCGVASVSRDITERKRMEAQLQHNALHDRLTGVANRSLFMDRLAHVIARADRFDERYALFVMDLDNFKLINDSAGHLVGDRLLCAFADRVKQLLRPVDTLARFGGDEFVLLLEDTDEGAAVEDVAVRILAALRSPFHLEGQELTISSSIGITLSDGKYREPDHALRDADLALYEAKRRGKNQYVIFDARMRGEKVSRLYLESELRRALLETELMVEFQPIVDLQADRIVGCEALVRWCHATMGQVEPGRFIHVAEETGLITPLGRFVLERSCQALADWLQYPGVAPEFYVSVNISPKEFYAGDLVPFVGHLLQRHGLQGHNIRLEITESVVIQHDREATAILLALQAMGIQVCMDDFGTGYSSLSYLHQLPFNIIKVDRSFVQRLAEKKQSREIVRSVLGLANALEMQTIAEGAETEAQLDEVRALGFRWAQGFVLHRPMNRRALQELLLEA